MSGTFRIAGLLTGIVLALALMGPAVFAIIVDGSPPSFDLDNDLANNAIQGTGGQTQNQANTNTQTSANSAENFGNGNKTRATAEANSGAVTVWGPKLIVKKNTVQNADSSASGNNTGGAQTQLNASAGGTNSGTRTGVGGSADTHQWAQGGSSGDTVAQNYTGAKQENPQANNATERSGGNVAGGNGGNGGTATGGGAIGGGAIGGAVTANAAGGSGGPANATANTAKTNNCNAAGGNAATGPTAGPAIGTSSNAQAALICTNGGSSPHSRVCCEPVGYTGADATGGHGGPAAAGNGNSTGAFGGPAASGPTTGGNGGNGGNPYGGNNGDNSGSAAINATALNLGSPTTAFGGRTGDTKNNSTNNKGGDGKVIGNQDSNGGPVDHNYQTATVGNFTGPAWNSDFLAVSQETTLNAASGNADNHGSATAATAVENHQNAANAAENHLTEAASTEQKQWLANLNGGLGRGGGLLLR